jgi:hypothetical protein
MTVAPYRSRSDLFIRRDLTDDEVASYEREGFLRVGRVLTDDGLQRMRDECMRAWEGVKEGFDPDKNWLVNSLLPNIHHHSKLVRDYYFDGPLLDVAQQVVGKNIKGATTQLTFKLRGNTMPFGWHQDNAYGELDPYNAISTLTALDDADEGNGCLWLVPGSHREGQAKVPNQDRIKKERLDINLDIDDSRGVPMPMKAGEAIFFHCWMLHKSQGNHSKDRDRRIVFMRYADADAVEIYNDRKPRLGPLLRGTTRFSEVEAYEAQLREERHKEGTQARRHAGTKG